VGSLITSILFAIAILLFYFRGLLNFYHKSRPLKLLAYLWILQNIFMVFSTAYRNNMYITESGLSYKKIGVYVYLLLAAIGLATTFYKLWRTRSNWSLVRANSFIMYCLLIIGCTINWDVVITNFNIEKSRDHTKRLEKYYLADIGFKNLPQLLALPDSVANTDDYSARDYYFSTRSVYFESFKTAMHNKLFRFMRDMDQPDWRSWCLEKERVLGEILELEKNQQLDSLDLQYFHEGLLSLHPISQFSNLRSLRIRGNNLKDAGEFAFFPQLEYLDIASTHVDSLEKFPALTRLKEIDITGIGAKDLLFLGRCASLERLIAKSSPPGLIDTMPGFSKLQFLDLTGSNIRSFMPLEKLQQLRDLRLQGSFSAQVDTFPVLPRLRVLDISGNDLDLSRIKIFEALGRSKDLTWLDISNDHVKNLYVLTDHVSKAGSYADHGSPPLNEKVTTSFPELRSLIANGCEIRSLGSCTPFPDLTTLHLINNVITDITPLAQLTQLSELQLGGNSISNITPLKGLTSLNNLDLSHNPVKDISALAELKQLTYLDLSNCYISDISVLSGLTHLRTLNLYENYISDISGVGKLQELETLYIGNNKIKDLTPLFALQHLHTLYISNITPEQLEAIRKQMPETIIYPTFLEDKTTDPNNREE
jgi:Leucine-rich repeat (LRR) protein